MLLFSTTIYVLHKNKLLRLKTDAGNAMVLTKVSAVQLQRHCNVIIIHIIYAKQKQPRAVKKRRGQAK